MDFQKSCKPARVSSTLSAILILLFPALWNGFPLLVDDTGAYLARWFEGTLSPNRSTTYGLFLAAGWPLDFWPVVVLQALAAVWIVGLVLRTHRLSASTLALPAVVAALAITTALPWLASELLTDIFAGLAVLGLHALVYHRDRIAPAERAALIAFIGFAGSTHNATYAVLLGLSAAALAVSFIWGNERLVPRAGLAPMATAIALGAAMLLGANYVVSGTLAWTPGGYGFAFARMLQDGIVTRYLDDHCPDPQLRLCPYRSELPLDADKFLWRQGVFDRLGRFSGLGDEMRTIVLGSLRDYPSTQFEAALRATARQLVAVGTGEGVVTPLWAYGILERDTPTVLPAMYAARQQHGGLPFARINRLHEPVAWLAMALIPLVALLGLVDARFADLGMLAATVWLALLGNAAVCGVLSNPHARYGSRIVWIAAFVAGLAAWRASTTMASGLKMTSLNPQE